MELPAIPPHLTPGEAKTPSDIASEVSSASDPEDDTILFSKALSLKEAGNDSVRQQAPRCLRISQIHTHTHTHAQTHTGTLDMAFCCISS
jgi:hypothetical protein